MVNHLDVFLHMYINMTNHLSEHGKPLRHVPIYLDVILINHLYKHDKPII